jgi:hypothetical protein
MPGFVYAFVNPSMPGVVKIGATEREVTDSLAEANSLALSDYTIACYAQVEDPFAEKRGIRTALATMRVHPRRDFYRATTDEARALFAQLR